MSLCIPGTAGTKGITFYIIAPSHSALVSHLFLLSLPSAPLQNGKPQGWISPRERLVKQELAFPQKNPSLKPMQIVFAQFMAKTQVYRVQYIWQL